MTFLAIEHVTITTGATRMSSRSEVSTDVVDKIRMALAADGRLGDTGWRVTLLPTPDGAHVYDLKWRCVAMARCWLCEDRNLSTAVWEAASAARGPGVILREPSRTPWLAAAITLSAADRIARPEFLLAMGEAGDLERCVAWALLE